MSTAKKPALSPSLVTVRKGDAAPTSGVPPRAIAADAGKSQRTEPLNFRVSAEFRRRFKIYAAEHDLSLSDLLEQAFRALETGQH